MTAIVCVPTEGSPGVSVIVPAYWPAGRAEGFTLTVSDVGVVAVLGATFSQLPPLEVVADTAKVKLAPPLVIVTACDWGTVPPDAVNTRDEGCMTGGELPPADTVKLTGTEMFPNVVLTLKEPE